MYLVCRNKIVILALHYFKSSFVGNHKGDGNDTQLSHHSEFPSLEDLYRLIYQYTK